MRRNLSCIAAVAAIGALALSGCQKKNADADSAQAAGPARIRDVVRLAGKVQPVTQVDLKSEVSGRITKLHAREGDSVARGQLLVELDPTPFQLRVDRAAITVDRTRLALTVARRNLERSKALIESGSVSKDALQDLEVAVSKAELDLRDAELNWRETRKDLADSRIAAPMQGRLISLDVEEGEMVAAATSMSGGTAMGTVADPRRMKVEVEVGELDFPRLKKGMEVEISSEALKKPLKGQVTFISSSAKASTSSGSSSIQVFPVEVEVADDRSLVPGLTVAVDFLFLDKPVEVAVPYAAVKTGKRKGSATVTVRGPDGKPIPKQVKVGDTDYRNIEILEGLVAGDSVIVTSSERSSSASGNAGGGPPGAR
jgi:RND family efflux transporter MFP subunit